MDVDDAWIAARKSRVRFLLLGPVRMIVDGQVVRMGGAELHVLAMLLLEPNEVVPLDRIVDTLWAGDPPLSAPTTVQVHVSRLRQRLAEARVDAEILVTQRGYRLVVDESLIDVFVVLSMLARARELSGVRRVGLLEEAASFWRGPALADLRGLASAPELVQLRELVLGALKDAREQAHGPAIPGWGLSEQHLLPDAIVAYVDNALSPKGRERASAHLSSCSACAAAVAAQQMAAAAASRTSGSSGGLLGRLRKVPEWLGMNASRPDVPEDVDDTDQTGVAGSGGGVDTALRTATFAVSIYLSDGAGHKAVEEAVTRALELAGVPIVDRDDPVLGSWFRRLWANPAAREVAMTAAHVADTRLVHQPDAQVTATLLQHIGPVITALQPEKEAVVRLGAVLIIKINEQLMVHQLTAAQQFRLDHQPQMVAPRDIISALGLPPPTNGHSNCSPSGIEATAEEAE